MGDDTKSEEQRMSEIDNERYVAFKRGIGHGFLSGPNGAHAAAIAYVRECRERDAKDGRA